MSTTYATAEAVRDALAAAAKVEQERQARAAADRARLAVMAVEGYRHIAVTAAAVLAGVFLPLCLIALGAYQLGWIR